MLGMRLLIFRGRANLARAGPSAASRREHRHKEQERRQAEQKYGIPGHAPLLTMEADET